MGWGLLIRAGMEWEAVYSQGEEGKGRGPTSKGEGRQEREDEKGGEGIPPPKSS